MIEHFPHEGRLVAVSFRKLVGINTTGGVDASERVEMTVLEAIQSVQKKLFDAFSWGVAIRNKGDTKRSRVKGKGMQHWDEKALRLGAFTR